MNKLLLEITPERLREMGFVEENDGTGDPRGVDLKNIDPKAKNWMWL